MKKSNSIIAIAAAALFAASPAMSITSPVIGFEADGQPASDALLCAIGVFLAGGADDGKTYLLIGEHKPLNSELAQYAAKKITVEGKVTSRDGVNMIENAVIQK